MTSEQRYIARLLFKNKVLKSDGQAFEDLFTAVMIKANPNFTQVKPQGSIGDRKNDGWDRTKGLYYQVYAPENLLTKQTEAIDKLEADFKGLKAAWNDVVQIRGFYFVLNDKCKGAYPKLEIALAKIKTDHSLEAALPFLVKDLEEVIFSLLDDVIFEIIGHVPSPTLVENVQFAVLNEVVEHLHKNGKGPTREDVLRAPDFETKIQINGLSQAVASMLRTASFQVGEIERYFGMNSQYAKEDLKDYFVSLYLEGREKHKDEAAATKADQIFFSILESAVPKTSRPYHDAALVVMSYFFEACDIFEAPGGE
jgi:hypothetical protein